MKTYLRKFADNITKKINKLNTIALFVLFVPVFSFASPDIVTNSLVSTIPTRINVEYDGKTESFFTNKFVLEDALGDHEIKIEDKDAVYPEKDFDLNGGTIDVRVQRATPILLDDSGKKKIIYSGYTDPSLVLRQNLIKLYAEDKVSSELVSDFYRDSTIGQKIKIDRAPVIYINVDGKKREVRTWAKKVIDALNEKKILIGEKDRVEPKRESSVKKGLEITITRVAESEVKEKEGIQFSEEIIEDVNTFVGQDYIKQAGQNGVKENLYKLISENGSLVSKTLMSSKIISEPTPQVKIVGTKPYNATTLWPTIVDASNQFGVSASKMHSVMMCESGGNQYAGSYYKGIFQYDPDTWAGASAAYPGGVYLGASIYDPIAQIYVTAWKASRQGWGAWGCA